MVVEEVDEVQKLILLHQLLDFLVVLVVVAVHHLMHHQTILVVVRLL
jgi:hypothetical protein